MRRGVERVLVFVLFSTRAVSALFAYVDVLLLSMTHQSRDTVRERRLGHWRLSARPMNVDSDLCLSAEQRSAANCNGWSIQRFVGDVDLPEGIFASGS
jgi:hypothetical protein